MIIYLLPGPRSWRRLHSLPSWHHLIWALRSAVSVSLVSSPDCLTVPRGQISSSGLNSAPKSSLTT